MIHHLNSSLTDITYVFNEPSINLHPHNIQQMNDLLLQLHNKNNTILVVEHKPKLITITNHIINLNPNTNTNNNKIMFENSIKKLQTNNTITNHHLNNHTSLKPSMHTPSNTLKIHSANTHNLRNVNINIPLNVLIVLTNITKSNKNSLVNNSITGHNNMVLINQNTIRNSQHNNPTTYTKLLDPIHKTFTKTNNVKPALFNTNSKNTCPNCNNTGIIYTKLTIITNITSTYKKCNNKRFDTSILEYTFNNKNINKVLTISINKTKTFFNNNNTHTPTTHKILQQLANIKLNYLTINQPLTTLSNNKRQQLKLATHIKNKNKIYILNKPTTNLHLTNVKQLLNLLNQLINSNKSMIMIEHHQTIMAHTNWIINLNPNTGQNNNQIIFKKTPTNLIASRSTLTNQHLTDYMTTT